MATRNPLPFSNQFERGHSFNWAGKWTAGKYYMNDEYVTDFINFESCILACRENHLATENNKPVIIYDPVNNTPIDVEGNLWSFVNAPINGNVFQFVDWDTYKNLENNNLIKPHTLYFIYDIDE